MTNHNTPLGRTALHSETITFWQQRSGQPVSEKDAHEMVEAVKGYFKLLAEWDAVTHSRTE